MNKSKDADRAPVHAIVRQHRVLVAEKVCDECGYDSVIITMPIERGSQEIKTGDHCQCPKCELTGTVVLHGAMPSGDEIEDTFDVAWIDPETGGDYRV